MPAVTFCSKFSNNQALYRDPMPLKALGHDTFKGIGSRYKALIVTILGWLAARGECAHARLRID